MYQAGQDAEPVYGFVSLSVVVTYHVCPSDPPAPHIPPKSKYCVGIGVEVSDTFRVQT